MQAQLCAVRGVAAPQGVFSKAVARRPWRRASAGGPLVEERPGSLLPLRSWLALWAALAAASPRKCLEHLLLLGYAGEPGALLAPSRPRRIERGLPSGPARGVFQVSPAEAPGWVAQHVSRHRKHQACVMCLQDTDPCLHDVVAACEHRQVSLTSTWCV